METINALEADVYKLIKGIKQELSASFERIILLYLPSFSANTDSSLMLNGSPSR